MTRFSFRSRAKVITTRSRKIAAKATCAAWLRAFVSRWLPYHLDYLIPCIFMVASAIFFTVTTLHKANIVLNLARTDNYIKDKYIFVKRLYLGREDYLEYSPTLTRLNPGVVFAISKSNDAMTLVINNEELFPDLMMGLHTMQSFRPGVAWEITEMCVKACPDKEIARVSVKGFKQELRQP